MDATASRIAHLYRRAGFGARPDEVDAGVARGYEATVERLLTLGGPDPDADAVTPPTFTPVNVAGTTAGSAERKAAERTLRQQGQHLAQWWVARMAAASNPLAEKLTLFWHGHFATSIDKVRFPELMYRQNQLFRTMGGGGFEGLTQAVAKDPAMLLWLDANTDKKGHPNENFARELFELFTLGLGNYSEDDVKAAARAFTGWTFNRASGQFHLQPAQHDDDAKTLLGQTGDLGGEDVIRIAVHEPASTRFIVAKVWSHFAWPVTPDDPVVGDLLPAYGSTLDVASLLHAVFMHPQFVADKARTGLVKQPIEYVVGALRALRVPAFGVAVLTLLQQLGQVPFAPPNVGGWPQNGYWLTTASSYARLRFATAVVRTADLSAVASVPAAARADAAARLLSVDRWSTSTTTALQQVADDPRSLVALALVSPEYVLN